MPAIEQKYLDQNGNIKPLADLIGAYKEHDAGPVELSPETMPSWFNSDGTAKPLSQIRDERAEVQWQKQRIEAEVRARTERVLTPEDKLIRAYSEQIERHEQDARYLPPAQAREARQYIDSLKAMRSEVADKVEREKREAEFAVRPEVLNAKAHASTYAQTLPPGCTPQAAAILHALAARTDCTVEEYTKAFWTQAQEIETSVHAERSRIAAERREVFAKAAGELAEAEKALQESKARHQQLYPPSVEDAVYDATNGGAT